MYITIVLCYCTRLHVASDEIIFTVALRPHTGHGLLILEFPRPHNHATQSVGLLWTRDQLVAKTSTRQHTTFTRENNHDPGGI